MVSHESHLLSCMTFWTMTVWGRLRSGKAERFVSLVRLLPNPEVFLHCARTVAKEVVTYVTDNRRATLTIRKIKIHGMYHNGSLLAVLYLRQSIE